MLDLADCVRRALGEHDAREIDVEHRNVGPLLHGEGESILVGIGAEAMEVGARELVTVGLGSARRQELPARVVEAAPVRKPLGRRVAVLHAIDLIGQILARGNVDHVEDVVLRPRRSEPVRHQLPVVRRLVEADRIVPAAFRLHRRGIDEKLLIGGERRARVELGEVLLGANLEIEEPSIRVPADAAHAKRPPRVQLLDAREQFVANGNPGKRRVGVVGLPLDPGPDFRGLQVLHVAIGVGDLDTPVFLRDRANRRDGRSPGKRERVDKQQ